MVDVLPGWTVRGVNSSGCIERKDGSETDRKGKKKKKKVSLNATRTQAEAKP